MFPLRLLAVVYTDVFRGVPVILLVYLVGFGVPALDVDIEPVILGGIALTALLHAPTSPRSTAPGCARSIRPSARRRSPSG